MPNAMTTETIMADERAKTDVVTEEDSLNGPQQDTTNDNASHNEQDTSINETVKPDESNNEVQNEENQNSKITEQNEADKEIVAENNNQPEQETAGDETKETQEILVDEAKLSIQVDVVEVEEDVLKNEEEEFHSEMPVNEAIPEEEEGQLIEIAHSASREGTPHRLEEGSLDQRGLPDAYSTPPPPQIEDDEESKEFHDFYEAIKDHSDHGFSPEYPMYDRAQLIDRYKEALEERSQLDNTNNQLQHKLAEYFKKKKTDDRVQEVEKNVTDQEQRYMKYISNLEELQNEEKRQEEEIRSQIEELKQKCQEKQEKVENASEEYMKFKYDIAKSSINSRSGKQLPLKDLEIFQAGELKKEQEVIQVRLENIKLKNRLRKKEQQLKAKEELAEGLHLIDFEQLKIENQTYNEKIEERNEEILKLRKKITTTVQVLTHLKEKLQFVQGENCEQRAALKQIESTVAQKRDVLTRTKQVRDALRIDNIKLKQKCGLLGNESLLRDFELRKDESDDLGERINSLKTDHVGLSMNLNGVKKKIRQTRNNSA